MIAGETPKAITSDSEFELGAERRLAAQRAGDAAVHAVEHGGDDDATTARSHSPAMAKRMPDRPEQRASAVTALGTTARSGMPRRALGAGRSSPHWATPSISSETPIRATIVSPAMVRWPSRTCYEVPAGR